MTTTKKPTTTKKKVVTQKYPYYPKPNKSKWQSEIKTKKDQREYDDYYGKKPS